MSGKIRCMNALIGESNCLKYLHDFQRHFVLVPADKAANNNIVVWEVRKQILYGDDACPSHLQSQSSVGDLGGVTGVDGHRSGKLDKRGKSVNVHVVYILVLIHVCVLVCFSAHGSGCVVDGGSATAAI